MECVLFYCVACIVRLVSETVFTPPNTGCNVLQHKELERQFSPSQWSHRMSADDVIKSHVTALKEGTERARGLAQTLLNVPYGEGEGEKLDVYVPITTSLGAFLVSGIYDLLPILSTYVNEPLKMTEEVALRNSPSQLVPQLKLSSSNCDIVVAVAHNDSPEFRKQSEDYYKALESTEGLKVTLEDVPNTDHFNIIEQLVDRDYHLTQLLLKMMGKS